MKKRISFGLILFVLALTSCKDTAITPNPVANTNGSNSVSSNAINNWIYSVMSDAYFWASQLPAKATLDFNSDPGSLFEKLIYQRSTVDRFSTITDHFSDLQNSFNGVNKVFGLRYTVAYLDGNAGDLGLYISDVIQNSPADKAGIKRGDIIVSIDNQSITSDNFRALFSSSDTHTFGYKESADLLAKTYQATISRAVVEENPVAFSKVIDLPNSGKKLGYVQYNQFIPGSSLDSVAYDKQLVSIFENMQSSQISELVLDLRFNGGGYISSAEVLASLIVKRKTPGDIFYKEQWNDSYQKYFRSAYGSDYFNHPFVSEAANLGDRLNRVFILTSNSTASASELVINGLKPYMDVIVVGENTYGKNLFGSLIGDDVNPSDYGIYVMLGQTANALDQSDYGTVNGITPDYVVADDKLPYFSIGDPQETLFAKVLEVLGETPANQTARVKPVKRGERLSSRYFKEASDVPMAKSIIRLPGR